MIDRNMFCKLKVVVDFLRIVVCLLFSRPFVNRLVFKYNIYIICLCISYVFSYFERITMMMMMMMMMMMIIIIIITIMLSK